jgi:hypothetical protein
MERVSHQDWTRLPGQVGARTVVMDHQYGTIVLVALVTFYPSPTNHTPIRQRVLSGVCLGQIPLQVLLVKLVAASTTITSV